MASGNAPRHLSLRNHCPLCHTCFVPSTALKHDHARSRSNPDDPRSPVSTSFLPWFYCEAYGHITDAVLHIDATRFSFSMGSRCFLRVRLPYPRVRPALPYARTHSLRLFLPQFPCAKMASAYCHLPYGSCLCRCSLSLVLCFKLFLVAWHPATGSRTPRFLAFFPLMLDLVMGWKFS
jgi:hypothetical protein